MNPQDVFYVRQKCVQILCSSINNPKIHLKCIKPIDRMGQIWTAYLLCTRITLETTDLRVMYSSINSSKIYPKCTKPTDSMDQIWTTYLLCTRITLETTALRVMSSNAGQQVRRAKRCRTAGFVVPSHAGQQDSLF